MSEPCDSLRERFGIGRRRAATFDARASEGLGGCRVQKRCDFQNLTAEDRNAMPTDGKFECIESIGDRTADPQRQWDSGVTDSLALGSLRFGVRIRFRGVDPAIHVGRGDLGLDIH